ncbi:MAG: hypothetical protein ACP5US_00555 [Candidatus Kryptoniota bacterium]
MIKEKIHLPVDKNSVAMKDSGGTTILPMVMYRRQKKLNFQGSRMLTHYIPEHAEWNLLFISNLLFLIVVNVFTAKRLVFAGIVPTNVFLKFD